MWAECGLDLQRFTFNYGLLIYWQSKNTCAVLNSLSRRLHLIVVPAVTPVSTGFMVVGRLIESFPSNNGKALSILLPIEGRVGAYSEPLLSGFEFAGGTRWDINCERLTYLYDSQVFPYPSSVD